MRQKILLLHGWGGSDYPHWQSWLAGELARDYGYVNFLKYSDPHHPKLSVWLRETQAALEEFQPDVVVCHSLANTVWFHLCNMQKISANIQKLYLVAPPSMECSISELQEFFPLKAPKKLYSDETLLITSKNDPYMTQEEAQTLQKSLNVAMKVIQDGGHLNAQSGYGAWPWILEDIQATASKR
jgi:predicted alpha/beta hydrolase family esterase